ncbi:MAG: ornithine cyclodeaminase family protein [Planctomycetes bacterium]|nr:ornithine cyclodeaminase family protein [Planctomycetota bacterium]MBI3847811.1 ornithine cyclodeaminase family protein [Planctomycetota bacterium]
MQFDEEEVRRRLDYDSLIPAMEEALAAFSNGEVAQPVRTVVPVREHGGFFGVMPAYWRALGAKLVTFYPGNAARGVETHLATILLFEPETGRLIATLDGRLITEMRTAAVSAAATKALARPDAHVLALLGSGVQARSHLDAISTVRRIDDARVWSPRNARRFEGARACATAEEAVRGADIVVTVTSSTTPVLRGEWLSPGAHVNAVGACRPDWRELDDETMRRSRLFVDSREAAAREAGDVILSKATPVAEIGDVFAGRARRESPTEITLFKSLGLAVEDVTAARLVLERAPHPPR